jgi:hypothetical protein
MRTWIILGAALWALGAGCAGTVPDEVNTEEQGAIGTLQLSLRGMDERMQLYRLRNATFDVQGTRFTDFQFVTSTLSSDTDLDSPVARAALFHGVYSIALRPEDWYLERVLASGGTERVADAVLLSSSSQQFQVQQDLISRVTFQFGVGGQLIDFFGGELEVGIDVRNAPDAGGESALVERQ